MCELPTPNLLLLIDAKTTDVDPMTDVVMIPEKDEDPITATGPKSHLLGTKTRLIVLGFL